MLAIVLPAWASVLTVGLSLWESRHPPRAVTARVIDCFEQLGKGGSTFVLKLDGPPGQVECSPDPFDVSSDLREVCSRRATVEDNDGTTICWRNAALASPVIPPGPR